MFSFSCITILLSTVIYEQTVVLSATDASAVCMIVSVCVLLVCRRCCVSAAVLPEVPPQRAEHGRQRQDDGGRSLQRQRQVRRAEPVRQQRRARRQGLQGALQECKYRVAAPSTRASALTLCRAVHMGCSETLSADIACCWVVIRVERKTWGTT